MAQVDPAARRIADEALLTFATSFAPYAATRMREAKGPDWDVRLGLRSGTGLGNSQVRSIDDPSFLLDLIRDEAATGLKPPSGEGPRVVRLARELKDLRHALAHFDDFEAPQAVAAVDAVRRLLASYALDPGQETLARLATEAGALAALNPVGPVEIGAYLDSLDRRLRWLDLAGIGPQVDSALLRQDLADVYVEPLLSVRERRPPRTKRPRGSDRDSDPGADVECRLGELREQHRLVVLGAPGAGKSTLLRVFARRLAFETESDRRVIPILLRAAAFGAALEAEPTLSLRRFLLHRATDRWGATYAHALETGTAFVFIDGLDEAGAEAQRADLSDKILEFAIDFPEIPVWVSSRPFGYRPGRFGAHFVEATILPLDDAGIAELIGRWDTVLDEPPDEAMADDEAPALASDIAGNKGLRDLASNPLLLTILYFLARRGGRLPERRIELYAAITETLLRDWPTHRFGRRFDAARFLEVLQPIALQLLERGDDTIREGELRPWLHDVLVAVVGTSEAEAGSEVDEILRVIEEQTGFFVEAGRVAGERHFAFLHRTFAEYLAARELAESWERGTLEWDRLLFESRWTEVRDLLVGHVAASGRARATKLLRDVLAHRVPGDPPAAVTLRFVLMALAGDINVDAAFREETLCLGIDRYLGTKAPAFAERIFHALVAACQAGVPSRAQRLLQPSSGESRLQALRKALLQAAIDPGDVDSLARVRMSLLVDDRADVEDRLIGSFVRILARDGDQQLDDAFVLVLDRAVGIDEVTGESLVEAGWPCIDVARVYEDPGLVRGTGPLLVDRRDFAPSVAEFLRLASSLEDPIGPFALLAPSADWVEDHESDLVSLAADPRELPRSLVAMADTVKYVEVEEVLDGLRHAIAVGGMGPARLDAIRSLYDFPDGVRPGYDEVVAAAISDGDPVVRHAIIRPRWEVGYVPNGEVRVPIARRCLEGERIPWVRGAALRALLEFDGSRNVFSILSDPDTFSFAPADLGLHEDLDGVVTRLVTAAARLEADEAEPIIDAAVALVIGNPEPLVMPYIPTEAEWVAEAIADRCLQSTTAHVRQGGLAILGVLDGRGPYDKRVIEFLVDPDHDVRDVAAIILGPMDITDPSVVADLVQTALQHGPPSTALYLGDSLEERVSDPEVRAWVRTILGEWLEADPDSATASEFASAFLP